MNDALATRKTVTELVQIYEQAVADVRMAFATIADAEKHLNDAFAMNNRDLWIGGSRRGVTFSDPERTLALLRRDVWRSIVDRLEIRRVLSTRRATDLEMDFDKTEWPEVTYETVMQFAQSWANNIEAMAKESICEAFELLRPRGSRHKTNTELEIGQKVVIPNAVKFSEMTLIGCGFGVTLDREYQFQDLERALSVLDGRGQIAKTFCSQLHNQICASEDGRGETEYFRFKCFKNGNLHLEFKRLDLLKRFNEIAGGKRLRPAA